MKTNVIARLKASQVKAASPAMKPEMDTVFRELRRQLGDKYKAEEHDDREDVYWELQSAPKGFRGGGGDSVLFSVMYDTKKDAICFEVEGDMLEWKSPSFKSAEEAFRGLHKWAHSAKTSVGIEKQLLSKLARV
jgi:hypothetical protein